MIYNDLKDKMVVFYKSGQKDKLEVLKFLKAEVQNKEIDLRGSGEELTDEMVFKIIRKQIKNRMDNIDLYTKTNHPDKVQEEEAEMAIWKEFAAMFPFELSFGSQK